MRRNFLFSVSLMLLSASVSATEALPSIISFLLDEDDQVKIEEVDIRFSGALTDIPDIGSFNVSTLYSENKISTSTPVRLDVLSGSKQGSTLYVTDDSGELLFATYHSRIELASSNAEVSIESIADSFIALSPLLFAFPGEERELIIQRIKQLDRYPLLIALVRKAIERNPETLIDADENADIYVLAANLIESIYSENSVTSAINRKQVFEKTSLRILGDTDYPHIADLDDFSVAFLNPTMAYYGVEVDGKAELLMPGKKSVVSLLKAFDGFVVEPTRVDSNLDDGVYSIGATKEFWKSDASKLANVANGLQMFCHVLDLLDYCPYGQDTIVELSEALFVQTGEESTLLKTFFRELFVQRAASKFSILDYLNEPTGRNATETNFNLLIKYIFPETDLRKNPARKVFQNTKRLLGQATKALKLYKAGNVYVPFLFDLTTKPGRIDFCITSSFGVLSQNCAWSIPKATFITTSSAPAVAGDTVSFDASATTDISGDITGLQFRWDFNGDGEFDTDWVQGDPLASHQYMASGTYDVTLEVMNLTGNTGIHVDTIVVLEQIEDVEASLVAYFEFEENVLDASSYANHGMENGGITYGEGVRGKAANFDGIDDIVSIPSSLSLDIEQDFSITMFVRTDGMQNGQPTITETFLLNKDQSYGVGLINSSNNIATAVSNNSQNYSLVDVRVRLTDVLWSHVSIVKVDSQLFTYVNGELKGTQSVQVDLSSNSLPLTIGGGANTFFKGEIDELRIYDRALTEREITAIYRFAEAGLFSRDSELSFVRDRKNNLLWMDNGSGNTAVKYNIVENNCSNLVMGPYSNWQVPTLSQLESLVDISKSPTTNLPFENLSATTYISNSRSFTSRRCPTIDGHSNWGVNFANGSRYQSSIYNWSAFCNVGGYSNTHKYVCVHADDAIPDVAP